MYRTFKMNTHLIGPGTGRKKIKIYNSPEEYYKSQEGQEKTEDKREERKEEQNNSPSLNTSETNKYWIIPNVTYRQKNGIVHLLKGLLDGQMIRSQDQWVEFSKDAKEEGYFYVPDYPLFFNTLQAMYNLRTNPLIEEARKRIQELSKKSDLMTLTRIKYNPQGQDTIIHNYGMYDQYPETVDFVGEDGAIPAESPDSLYQKLLGTEACVQDINLVFRWLNETDANICRINHKLIQSEDRVTCFNTIIDQKATIYCTRVIYMSEPSLGMRFIEN